MKPLYTETEFNEAKSRTLLPLKCEYCGNTFTRTKHDIHAATNPSRQRDSCRFCDNSCQRKHDVGEQIDTECAQCHSPLKRHRSTIKSSKSGNVFCNQSCSAKWNNAHKKHGTRRSKLEKWLEEQLTAVYPTLEIHFNRKDAIQSELDIFIPSLRLAFELNGIFHYEPIYGQGKLDAIQSNDQRKFAACHEAGIELCIIDNSSLKYFKEHKARKFLNIITDIINTRLSGS